MYILPALAANIIEMKYPDSPKHPNQQYRLTPYGKKLKTKLKTKLKK